MAGSYEFLISFKELRSAHDRFELIIWALNTITISIGVYTIFLLLGLPAFSRFYWQGFFLFEYLPVFICLLWGALAATIIKRRKKDDVFALLGPVLSEMTRTAYDNREIRSIIMDDLAQDVKVSLANIKPSEILNWRQINMRIVLSVLLALIMIFIVQSKISADITPADFQSLSDLRDSTIGMLQKKMPSQKEINLSGNIYGKPSLAVLSEEKLDLILYPGIGTGSRASSTESVDRLFQQSQASEAAAVSSELYIESLPPQNKEIIKRYFEMLAKG
ncbi:MAG: hypothetical protein LUQ38_08215 [Methanotrichaceae archaeon]|nr:hypothetical protein [Methanotrichaceae archaeon]MDD1758798.1 hypothetical protein [Methanotrichaceae archaeon]